jgi:hypothetical protein
MIRDFCGSKSIGTNCEKTNIPDLFNIRGLVDKIIRTITEAMKRHQVKFTI